MKTASKLLLILCWYCCIHLYCGIVEAALARGIFYNEANPGKCSYGLLVLSPGETAEAPNECSLVRCDSSDGWVTITSCISIAPPPHCAWAEYIDKNAPYPECCARAFQCVEMTPSNETLKVANQYAQNVYDMLRNSVANPLVAKLF